MAVVRALSYTRKVKAAKATIRYIQHRTGREQEKMFRKLFRSTGEMERIDAYEMLDTAEKGSVFFHFVISPDQRTEDSAKDLELRELTRQTMTVPAIRLNRMLTERELKRTIYVTVPHQTGEGMTQRNICIEPDGALDFAVNNTWRDFCYLEVYRHHLNKTRFQHKIQGYVTALAAGLHKQLFQASAMTVAVIATTEKLKER